MVSVAWQTVAEVLRRMQADLDSPWSLERAAAVSGYEQHHFAHLFREVVGEPPVGYHRRLRMERAAYHLARTGAPLQDVAARAGYGSPEAFSRAFRRQFGSTPGRFRRRAPEAEAARPAPLGEPSLRPPPGLDPAPRIERVGPLMAWTARVASMAPADVGAGMAALFAARPPDGPWQLGGVAQPWGWHTDSPDKEFRCLRRVDADAPPPPAPLLPWRLDASWFAVFEYRGALSGIDPACRWMADRWVSSAGLRLAYGPLFSLIEALADPADTRARLHLAVTPLRAA